MRAVLLYCLLISASVGLSSRCSATHIVGGDIGYRHLSGDSFEIVLTLYIDCINGSAQAIAQDYDAAVGIFDSTGIYIRQLLQVRTGPVRVNSVNYDCVIPPTNACVDKYTYTYLTTLPFLSGGYFLSFQRCCRNNTITNISSPGATGATYWAYIPDSVWSKGYNTAAVFKTLPPNFLCVSRDFIYDHSAADADGDSLAYELYTPYLGANSTFSIPRPPAGPPFRPVTWFPGFNADSMMRGRPDLKIDALTGQVTVHPVNTGQFVVGIAVKEFRKGKHIHTSRRDFQFNVIDCRFNVVSAFSKSIKICSDTVKFVNTSQGATDYKWEFGDSSGETSTLYEPVHVYKNTGTYLAKLVAAKGNCSDSVSVNVTVDRDLGSFAGPDTVICSGREVAIGSNSAKGFTYKWTPSYYLSDSSSARPVSRPLEPVTYYVTRTSEVCVNTDTVRIGLYGANAKFTYSFEQLCRYAQISLDSLPSRGKLLWYVDGNAKTQDQLLQFRFAYNTDYQVRQVIIDSACKDTLEKKLRIHDDDLFTTVPNVFTPNGDGVNDCFKIEHAKPGTPCDRLIIYNRWGAEVYSSDTDGSCWNGKVSGTDAAEGVYFYILEHRVKDVHGTITLIR